MPVLEWDKVGEHEFETGVDHGVLFVVDDQGKYQNGVAWNGLTGVDEQPEGAEANDQYADNIKYLTLRSAEKFGATIQAFTYPDEFGVCDGSVDLVTGVSIQQQPRRAFGFAYRTLVGNDIQGQNAGEKIHIIYGCTVAPSERNYVTVNDNPEAMTMSWTVDTNPVPVKNHQPTSVVVIDSTQMEPENYKKVTDALWGTEGEMDTNKSKILMPDEIVALINGD